MLRKKARDFEQYFGLGAMMILPHPKLPTK
jgi:hypothetical protein